MNSVLRHLELDGLIDRRPHPDSRRADSWSLTEAGLVELERAHRVGTSVFTKMLASFDADEVATFLDYMRRCIHALGGDDDLGLPMELRSGSAESACAAPWARQRFQNAGVNSTRNVKISSRPNSIAIANMILPCGLTSANVIATDPKPGPALLIEVATAPNAVI